MDSLRDKLTDEPYEALNNLAFTEDEQAFY